MEGKEARVRAITKLYYSNPKLQQYLWEFAQNRETVPRYYEGFGKRPDTFQYPSDIMGLVNKGATSFHTSEEIWNDPLAITSEMTPEQFGEQRKGWDLLIDVDSPFLDCSKIATELLIKALEHHGIKKYGIKFSGSKGFHIIVGSKAFPDEYDGKKMKEMFPEWPRAISEYLMNYIYKDYNRKAAEVLTNFEAIERRTNVSKQELMQTTCLSCGQPAKDGVISIMVCPICKNRVERRTALGNKKLRCIQAGCGGILEVIDTKKYNYCETCKDPENEKFLLSSDRYPEQFDVVEGVSAAKVAALDMVLVAPRHLYRMPYSLNEKTALASVVLNKDELNAFNPGDASPLKIVLKNYMPDNDINEARQLLVSALEWKRGKNVETEIIDKKRYEQYADFKLEGVEERDFPAPIKKLLNGLSEGKKRGLFILITFFRSIGYPMEVADAKIKEWNEKNSPPLKTGYIKSQLDWHFKQKKKILPPNYDNPSFYKDLGLIDKKPETKNPMVDVVRNMKKRS